MDFAVLRKLCQQRWLIRQHSYVFLSGKFVEEVGEFEFEWVACKGPRRNFGQRIGTGLHYVF